MLLGTPATQSFASSAAICTAIRRRKHGEWSQSFCCRSRRSGWAGAGAGARRRFVAVRLVAQAAGSYDISIVALAIDEDTMTPLDVPSVEVTSFSHREQSGDALRVVSRMALINAGGEETLRRCRRRHHASVHHHGWRSDRHARSPSPRFTRKHHQLARWRAGPRVHARGPDRDSVDGYQRKRRFLHDDHHGCRRVLSRRARR